MLNNLVTRFLVGAGKAGAFANVARVLSRWFPDQEHGRAQGLLLAASQVGGAWRISRLRRAGVRLWRAGALFSPSPRTISAGDFALFAIDHCNIFCLTLCRCKQAWGGKRC